MFRNEKNKKVGCHCEEDFNSTKQSSTPVLNQCVNNICTVGRKVEDCRVGVSHLLAMTRIGRSLEKIFKKIFRDDIIYFKVAAILGSCFASPRMTEKWRCPRMTKEVAEILGSKLSFCPRMTEKWRCPRMTEKWRCPRMTREVAEILGSCFASPRMTEKWICPRMAFSVLTLAAVLSFSTTGESWATACGEGQKLCGKDCIPSADICWDCAKTENDVCGAYLTDTTVADKKKLNISGTGKMTDWADASSVPWDSSRSNITELEISSGITSIGDSAFRKITSVTSLTIPDSVTSVGYAAFAGMDSVTNLTIPDSVTSIGSYVFWYMNEVTGTLIIPDSVTRIGDSAIGHMPGITELVIPDSWDDYVQKIAFILCQA